ncbi:MAG: hypothetical protein ACPGN3_05895 [Opitutales bacterium]
MNGQVYQLIFTSAPSGLEQGASGFCTVARSKELPEEVVQLLEVRSRYENWTGTRPWVHRFHSIIHKGRELFVITKIGFAGADYSHRANHIAHHLVFDGNSAGFTLSPAVILLFWTGWRERFKAQPSWIEPFPANRILTELKRMQPLLPAKHWEAMTQSPESAAAWLEHSSVSDKPMFLITDKTDTQLILKAYAESSALVPPPMSWEIAFTTFLQDCDIDMPLHWIGGLSGSFVDVHADRLHVQREHLSSKFSLKARSSLLKSMVSGGKLFVVS